MADEVNQMNQGDKRSSQRLNGITGQEGEMGGAPFVWRCARLQSAPSANQSAGRLTRFFFWWCLTKWMQHTSKTRGKQQKITRRRLCAPTGALRRSAFVVQFGPFPLLRSTHFHPIRVLGESVPSSVTWSMQKSANFFWYGDFVCQLQHFMQIRCKFPVTLSMVTRSVDWL